MKPLLLIVAGFLLSCMLFTNTACRKKTDCVATVHCVDSSGNSFGNVNVQLFAIVRTSNGGTVVADVKASGDTDADGKVKFTFKLPAIYDIRATTKIGTKTYNGTGIIKLEEGETVEKAVTVR
ncbi:MAG: hypothetical protein IPM51_16585 [Sphingobacteriaceae bacterium]|nr:hypothetical protein [Sphingobacteriaceae bacterium]